MGNMEERREGYWIPKKQNFINLATGRLTLTDQILKVWPKDSCNVWYEAENLPGHKEMTIQNLERHWERVEVSTQQHIRTIKINRDLLKIAFDEKVQEIDRKNVELEKLAEERRQIYHSVNFIEEMLIDMDTEIIVAD